MKWFLAVILSLSVIGAAQAQESGGSVQKLDDIVVTGSRTERKLADSPVATEVINREEIEATGAENVGEFLENYPGLEVVRSFTGFGDGVRMQGLDPKYTLILINGERAIGRLNGSLDLRRFKIDSIERIEIVKGSSSALYGSDAIGGVINIITRGSEKDLEADVETRYGSYNIFDLDGGLGLRHGDWNTFFSSGWHRGDPYDLNPADVATTGSGFEDINFTNRTEYKPNASFKIFSNLDYLYRDLDAVDSSTSGAVFDRFNRTESFSVQLGPSYKFNQNSKLSLTTIYSFYRDQYLTDQRGSAALDSYQETKEELVEISPQYDQLLFQRHLVSLGVEAQREGIETPRLLTGGEKRYGVAPYIQDEWRILDEPNLVLVPGFRYDYDSEYGDSLSPKVSVRLDPIEKVILRTSYGRGFRAPNFRELFLLFENPSVGYTVEGNPNLEPETSHNINAGIEYYPHPRIWTSVNYFYNNISNLIETVAVQTFPLLFSYRNLQSVHTQGVETALNVKVLENLLVKVGYTFLDSENEQTGQPLSDRPEHRGTFSATYDYKPWDLQAVLRGSVTGERPFEVDSNLDLVPDQFFKAPGYTNMDFRIGKGLGKHLEIFVGGDNLLDEGDVTFITLRPRTFYGGLTFHFDINSWKDLKKTKEKES